MQISSPFISSPFLDWRKSPRSSEVLPPFVVFPSWSNEYQFGPGGCRDLSLFSAFLRLSVTSSFPTLRSGQGHPESSPKKRRPLPPPFFRLILILFVCSEALSQSPSIFFPTTRSPMSIPRVPFEPCHSSPLCLAVVLPCALFFLALSLLFGILRLLHA